MVLTKVINTIANQLMRVLLKQHAKHTHNKKNNQKMEIEYTRYTRRG